ncbi:PIN domain-containing protein [Ignicoccus hospitalis]|uniref:VapC9 PIN-like domain-containing protein n=1 Tax=Ignicoccus hospitalis (strain KIN4/I / DSM 18386 / JCM 14125) TaxID=453591 RepID=A8A8H8_IGNH4|nr:PIN domain-containing protein [Ignicoccus hospitalis]ABU81230.1 hypothetical protein Igni_0046 [Ignicoccus hospitalis KIN4/I]HIH90660.1 hypothetical protein [Desulfurococcaceae archaeon]
MRVLDERELERLKRRLVIADTSVLLLIAEGIDVIGQIEEMGGLCAVTPSVLRELERISEEQSKRGRAARLVLPIVLEQCPILNANLERRTDDDIVSIALRYGLAVATADKGLRRRLLRKVPTIYYREAQRRLYSEDFFAY